MREAARLVTAFILLAGCTGGAAAPAPAESADLVVSNGRVWTGVPDGGIEDAVAIREGRIAAVGSSREISRWVGAETRVIDARGGLVVPGFIDSHAHFVDGGFSLSSVQLRDAATPEEFVRRIREFAATVPAGTWIMSGDWDHEQWGGELPRRQWIDSVTPEHPVWVNRLDGHMALANTRALREAGISRETPDVEGGTVVRDPAGEPTGVLKDNAMGLIEAVVPPPRPETMDRAVATATQHAAANGVTMVVHMGSWDHLAALRRAHAAGALKTRVYAAVPLRDWERLRDTVAAHGRGDDWVRIGLLKGFVDGSLGSHTAAFHAPYSDAPADSGLLVTSPEDLYHWTAGADTAGLQVAVHAIGDRANRIQLDIFERIARENGPRDRRFRIEHAQHIAPADLPRFAALGVIPSMQPYHAIDDGRWAERVIGPERSRTTYAFRSLSRTGARPAFGSDWPVAPLSPIEGLYAAVSRRTLDGAHPDGWVPGEKTRLRDALLGYTRDAAEAAFVDDRIGTLEPGKLADLVIMDRDILGERPERIRKAKVTHTIVGGTLVYTRARR